MLSSYFVMMISIDSTSVILDMPTSGSDATCAVPNEVTAPLDTLDQLLDWTESSVSRCLIGQPLNSAVQLYSESKGPRTLVCHDMAGGYLEDRFAHGCVAEAVYYLHEWPYVDIFVYFSHHLVTIPPVGWIDAAHTHNVLVLGTFITEWKPGEEICNEFVSDGAKLLAVADRLARIGAKYNFDGWLLNIENPVNNAANLVSFVGLVTAKCKEIIGQHATVIWYDSVTVDGQLKWQDALNECNRNYFDVCDGIFLNYGWDEAKLDLTVHNACDRSHDVYVGVDVFGRGCMGGGGFNCSQPLKCIRQRGLSAAIFAPGWVFETKDKGEFDRNQRHFWNGIAPGLRCRKLARIPVWTTFGRGKRWYPPKVDEDGKIVQRHFFCLRDQELQPHGLCPVISSWPASSGDEQLVSPPSPFFQLDCNADCERGSILTLRAMEKDVRSRLFCCQLTSDRPIRLSITVQWKENLQWGLSMSSRPKDASTLIYVFLGTLDVEKLRLLDGSKLSIRPSSMVSIGDGIETMSGDVSLAKGEILESIDLLVQNRENENVELTLHSFSLTFVENLML